MKDSKNFSKIKTPKMTQMTPDDSENILDEMDEMQDIDEGVQGFKNLQPQKGQ